MQKHCQISGMRPSEKRIKIRLDRPSILGLCRLGLTKKRISQAIQICERTIYRWLSRSHQTKWRRQGRPMKITNEMAAQILSSLRRNPFQTQEDVARFLSATIKVHQSTICRFLRREGWTRKKVTKKPTRLDEIRAEQWLESVAGQRLEDFMALDETSFVTTTTGVSHGYAPRGSPGHYQRDARINRERLTLLICIQPSDGKVVHHMIVNGSMNAVLFQQFIAALPT